MLREGPQSSCDGGEEVLALDGWLGRSEKIYAIVSSTVYVEYGILCSAASVSRYC